MNDKITILAISILCSYSVPAILIDDFSDHDKSPHLLTTLTDLHQFKHRLFDDQNKWTFSPENTLISPKGSSITKLYYVSPRPFKSEDLSTIHFTFADIDTDAPSGIYCNITVSRNPIDESDNEYTYDCPAFRLQNHTIHQSINLLTDESSINKIFDPNCLSGLFFSFGILPDEQDSHSFSLELKQIDTVPEPFSIFTLGTGIFRMINKKRCKTTKLGKFQE